jgi:glycosyltransferase involved in cell wall biosynthesis
MRGLVADFGVEERVTFHGWLDEDEVLERMRNARAVVFPSVWHEPAGLITLEAAAVGRPVIASAVGGIPEYALDDFALRVPVRDIDALSAAINQLATAPDRAERMGRQALYMARTRFAMDRFTRRIYELYRQSLERQSHKLSDRT